MPKQGKNVLFPKLEVQFFFRKPVIDDVAWEPVKFPEITLANITGFESKDIKVETVKNLAPREFWQSLGFLENQNLVLMKDEL